MLLLRRRFIVENRWYSPAMFTEKYFLFIEILEAFDYRQGCTSSYMTVNRNFVGSLDLQMIKSVEIFEVGRSVYLSSEHWRCASIKGHACLPSVSKTSHTLCSTNTRERECFCAQFKYRPRHHGFKKTWPLNTMHTLHSALWRSYKV